MKKTSIRKPLNLFFLFSLLFTVSTSHAQFYDSAEFPSWALDAIYEVNQAEIMTGFGDRTFRADQNLTRAEMVTLLLRAKNIDEEEVEYNGIPKFPDVEKGVWFEKALAYAENNEWVKGRADGKFYAGDNLTRAEFVTLIARSFDLQTDYDESVIPFEDVSKNDWFASSVAGLYERDLLRNAFNKNFRAGNLVSRADAAWVFAEIIKKPGIYNPQEVDLGESVSGYANSKKVAIKPSNFNAEKQSVSIEKNELYAWSEAASESVTLNTNEDKYQLFGNVRVVNRLDYDGRLESMAFKVRLDSGQSGVGPVQNFKAKLSGSQYEKEIEINKSGEAIFTSLDMSFESGEEKVFKFYISSNTESNFYKKDGEATVYLNNIEGLSFKPFISSSRVADVQSAPTGYGERQLAKLKFKFALNEEN